MSEPQDHEREQEMALASALQTHGLSLSDENVREVRNALPNADPPTDDSVPAREAWAKNTADRIVAATRLLQEET